jgi:hypothetical protein
MPHNITKYDKYVHTGTIMATIINAVPKRGVYKIILCWRKRHDINNTVTQTGKRGKTILV